ncbi:hypothetical protein J2S74_001301 [Evansella vedderi]|uniref:Novel STAND NTPase 3 domain-containing protein n=1 Tax=Evansella vedderi TaxID=38282 RepID=A0ABT9ZTX3_9BACI|nr:hypothetical protein [Evansella vedderi]MDQ0253928.1 hypothetical protein [Evansella vedderi]
MSRLQTIENRLMEINETVFQELCDSFLILRNSNYATFARTGSQTGKQKTTKGTPDSFFLLPDGKYIFVEYSTNITAGVRKLKEDIEKCLDQEKTGIKINDIKEIVLCMNFNLNSENINKLNILVEDKGIKLTLITLDSLALELILQHRDLVYQYLNLSFDTGQVVSLDSFIQEYNKASSGIATPLDNSFLHREEEKKELKTAIQTFDLVILNGAAGVGKTKLAIETIREFLIANTNYNAFCISYKNCDLLQDLYDYCNPNKDYILFVDDANRIDAFNQILGFYKIIRKGNLKIVITVRDYALNEVNSLSNNLPKTVLFIEKLKDEPIVDIIKAEPFKVLNEKYQSEILSIADGNPRLAIMAALLAIEKQDLSVLSNVSELFKKYFTTFINDKVNIGDKLTIQCLGIISFFYTLPYKNKQLVEPIIDVFEINYYDLIDTIEKLEKWELVEIQYEYVKVPEQNISNYFFYLSFIEKGYLSFELLLDRFFASKAERFKECVIAANNSFGSEKVMEKVRPSLLKYLKSIEVPDQSFTFLSTFWFYLQNEVLEYLYGIIMALPDVKVQEYDTSYEQNQFAYNKNNVIELLGNYFKFIPTEIKTTLELSFEYVRKQPEHLPELIHKIRETFSFEIEDERYGFYRQLVLFEQLANGINRKDILYSVAFFELAKTFLKFTFEVVKAERENKVVFYRYDLPYNEKIKSFRKNIWDTIISHFSFNNRISLDLLSTYCENYSDNKKIVSHDKKYILLLIARHLDPVVFEHCLFVQNYLRFLNKSLITSSNLKSLKETYRNELYDMYLSIDWDRIRDKDVYEFDDFREYETLKEQELRKSFVFETTVEVRDFVENYLYLVSFIDNNWNQNSVLDIIVDENFNNNSKIGLELLELILDKNSDLNYVPSLVFKNYLKMSGIVNGVFTLLERKAFNCKLKWLISFYENIEKSLLEKERVNQFIGFIQSIDEAIWISFKNLEHLNDIKEDFNEIILQTINRENRKRNNKIIIDNRDESLIVCLDSVSNFHTIKEMYIQQYFMYSYFDYKGKILTYILERDADFLLEFVEEHYSAEERKFVQKNGLGFIWRINNIENSLEKIIEITLERELYFGIAKHFCNVFFEEINGQYLERAKEFVLKYVRNNHQNKKKMNIVMDIIHNTRNEWFDDVIKIFLSQNQDTECFSKIWWIKRSRSYNGDQLWSNLEATDWRRILDIINEIDLGLKLIPIKRFVATRLEYLMESAEEERKQKFLRKFD